MKVLRILARKAFSDIFRSVSLIGILTEKAKFMCDVRVYIKDKCFDFLFVPQKDPTPEMPLRNIYLFRYFFGRQTCKKRFPRVPENTLFPDVPDLFNGKCSQETNILKRYQVYGKF